jgi:hypothetical protein
VAATAAPNNVPIPAGTEVFSCEFDVLARDRLPTLLRTSKAASSAPLGGELDTSALPGVLQAAAADGPVILAGGTGLPNPTGQVELPVSLLTAGVGVRALEHDLLFPTDAVALPEAEACTLAPGVGATMWAEVVDCGSSPMASGCPAAGGGGVARLRALIVAGAGDGMLPAEPLYRCVFEVVDESRLPTVVTVGAPRAQGLNGEFFADTASVDGIVHAPLAEPDAAGIVIGFSTVGAAGTAQVPVRLEPTLPVSVRGMPSKFACASAACSGS